MVEPLVDIHRELRWLWCTAAPALGRDEDDAVGRARAVDRRRGVLQDADALDVLRVEPLEPADPVRHAVDHDERAVVVQRVVAADPDGRPVVPGLAALVDGHEAGQLAAQRVRHVDRGNALDLLTLHRADRTGQRRLALLAITHRHHRVQLDRLRHEPEVGGRGLTGGEDETRHLRDAVADQPRLHPVRSGRHLGDGVATVRPGHRTEARADDADADARERSARRVGHAAGQRVALRRPRAGAHQDGRAAQGDERLQPRAGQGRDHRVLHRDLLRLEGHVGPGAQHVIAVRDLDTAAPPDLAQHLLDARFLEIERNRAPQRRDRHVPRRDPRRGRHERGRAVRARPLRGSRRRNGREHERRSGCKGCQESVSHASCSVKQGD